MTAVVDDHSLEFSVFDEVRYRLDIKYGYLRMRPDLICGITQVACDHTFASSALFDYPPNWRVRLFMLLFRLFPRK